MRKNMRYASFSLICERICDRIYAYNQHTWLIIRHNKSVTDGPTDSQRDNSYHKLDRYLSTVG